jgi:hypothetical protein
VTLWAERAACRLSWRQRRAAEEIGIRAVAWLAQYRPVEEVWFTHYEDAVYITAVLTRGTDWDEQTVLYELHDERIGKHPAIVTVEFGTFCPTDYVGEPAFRPYYRDSRCLWRRDSVRVDSPRHPGTGGRPRKPKPTAPDGGA